MEKHRKLYDFFTESKQLLKLFPELKKSGGNSWESDKERFSELQEEQEAALNMDLDLDDE